jgi:hypothetical protein
MRMMKQTLAPGVEHRDHSGLGSEMFSIGPDSPHCLRRGLEEDVVDDRLVLAELWLRDRCGHGEHDIEIGDGQQLGLSVSEPLRMSETLALRAMPVAAAIVGDAHVPDVVALLDMAAERWERHASMAAMTRRCTSATEMPFLRVPHEKSVVQRTYFVSSNCLSHGFNPTCTYA